MNDKGELVKTQVWLLLVRGDHSLNETKAGKVAGMAGFRFATEAEIVEHFGCKPGYLGPIGLVEKTVLRPAQLDITTPPAVNRVKIVADREVAAMADWICGANEVDFHITGVNWARDLPEPALIADIRNVLEGDPSPDGKGALAIERGIEIGHVFYLGTKYSKAMNATFLDNDGKPKLFEMGCYGIGITRLPAAAIEQNHDDKGIIWPDSLAPFTVVICPVGADRSEAVKSTSEQIYAELLAKGVDVILDDRGERPGAMFADWELIGVPHRITVGDKGLKDGQIEYQHRRDTAASRVAVADAVSHVVAKLTV